ncbi:MAG: YjfB family protein [Lachnospiraceae bacterium]|nr:YjfB family protein [Lachnospiraceae bacterium]
MNIASISMAMAQTNSLSQVGVAVLGNAMEANEIAGQGIVNMIDAAALERSVNPAVGSNFDMVV